ncbi:right-handed parallel beta-helix repeat-containing protein [Streptomyces sp. NPDC052415]|uniref:right-handed parallel beta-helix repeat-containing protein n=1 Tax=Streptomyces sp. NPDC052415 TaxID=3365690 RepID=UPI0037D8E6F4
MEIIRANAVSRRSMLALGVLPLAFSLDRFCRKRRCSTDPSPDDTVFVADYPTPQDAARAATGKKLVFPVNGSYSLTSLAIPAGCYVQGNGSTLNFPARSTSSSRQSDEILKVAGSGVTIDGLKFDANSPNQGATWSQHRHCIRVHGPFSDTTIKNCRFDNIIGDGVYVNVGASPNTIVGPGNTFTARHDNRNGISIVTADTIEVFGNTFTHCTRSDMPGPIDIEPNSSREHLAHVDVHDNIILAGSTSGTGTLPGIVYSGFRNAAAVDIKIRNNSISGARLSCGILAIGIKGGPFNAVTGLVISGNTVHDIGGANKIGIELDYWIHADVINNQLSGMQYGIYNYWAHLGATTGNSFTNGTADITNEGTAGPV